MKFICIYQQKRFVIKKYLITILFLSALFSCDEKSQQASFTRIIERGYVSVGTLYAANSFYAQGNDLANNDMHSNAYAGFEYELAKKYADYLNVELKIIPSYSLDELFIKLNTGEVDVLAAGLSVTDKRLSRFDFAPSYAEVSQKLVFKQGNIRPREISDLSGNLMVTASSSHAEMLTVLKQVNPTLNWIETAEFDREELLAKLLNDEIDYTIVDSNTLAINRRYYPEISVGFTINNAEPLAWMVSKDSDDAILGSLVEFFGQVHHDGTLLALDDKYYGHIEEFNYVETRTFIRAVETKLPQYRAMFEKYSQEIDWRLLAAISYQESHWKPHARSHTGVRGMMMLTLATAKQMGIQSRLDAEQSIRGGSKYFRRMIDKMPDRIPNPDRVWFALASYNVGFGHLNDARIITQQQGGDPDRWVDVKTRLPLLQQKKYYKKTKYGYARGSEPVDYVENIRRYYDTLTWLDAKSKEPLQDTEEETELAVLDVTE
ncbi:membrane-bound lytic murein transglycosylase MltF [Colwellia sp. MSW7]|uniref:Membrane-bound lytic murein transglycosylase F n=1 Tax=Colwellia maritima TaxID=2912588 RepID=A0ABS9X1I7_9GAMM|nr:membrane-bound lytic murein transglycosylase MltF [Colwellia maritima]MCI2283316.1 membrane-bound lytic murein transglycosylase MltF [Colwellia maritima]